MKIKDISIKWKILFAVAVGPMLIASVLAWLRVYDIRKGAERVLVEKSQAIVFMAEAARNEMAQKLLSVVIPPLDQIPPDKFVQAVPVITAINVAAENAEKSGYQFRVLKNSPRNPNNKPDPVERAVLEGLNDVSLNLKETVSKFKI